MILPEPISNKDEPCILVCKTYIALKWPALWEVQHAYNWAHEMNQPLKDLYPQGIPKVIVTGVLAYHSGIKHARNEQAKKRIRDLESKTGKI